MSVTYSPNMNLVIPGVGTEPGPQYATDINSSLSTIDSHNHTTGLGAPIPAEALSWTKTVDVNSQSLTNFQSLSFINNLTPLSTSLYKNYLFVSNQNLYFNDGNGVQTQITSGGALVSNYSLGVADVLTAPTQLASFQSGSFVIKQTSNVRLPLDARSVVLRDTSTSFGLELKIPTPTANWQLQLPPPTAYPSDSSLKVLNVDKDGIMDAYTLNQVGQFMGSAGANGIAATMTSTGANAIAATMTTTGTNSIISTMSAAGAASIISNLTNTPSFRNRLINGSMSVDQRNNGGSQTITTPTGSTFTITASATTLGVMTVTAGSIGGTTGNILKSGQYLTGNANLAANTVILSQSTSTALVTAGGGLGTYQISPNPTGNVTSGTITVNRVMQYTIDRWYSATLTNDVTGQRVAASTYGATDRLYAYAFTGGASSTTKLVFGQRVESGNAAYLASKNAIFAIDLATTESSPVTVTWKVNYANSTDQFGGLNITTLDSTNATNITSGTFTVSSSTLTRFTTPAISMPSNAINGVEVVLSITSLSNGKKFVLSNAQLEAGSLATAFENKITGETLTLCQRYYEIGSFFTVGYNTAGAPVGSSPKYMVTKFKPPAVLATSVSNSNCSATPQQSMTSLAVSTDSFISFRNVTASASAQFSETWISEAEL